MDSHRDFISNAHDYYNKARDTIITLKKPDGEKSLKLEKYRVPEIMTVNLSKACDELFVYYELESKIHDNQNNENTIDEARLIAHAKNVNFLCKTAYHVFLTTHATVCYQEILQVLLPYRDKLDLGKVFPDYLKIISQVEENKRVLCSGQPGKEKLINSIAEYENTYNEILNSHRIFTNQFSIDGLRTNLRLQEQSTNNESLRLKLMKYGFAVAIGMFIMGIGNLLIGLITK